MCVCCKEEPWFLRSGWCKKCLDGRHGPQPGASNPVVTVTQTFLPEHYFLRSRIILAEKGVTPPWSHGARTCASSPSFDDYCLLIGWPEPSEGAALPGEEVPWVRENHALEDSR